MEIYEALRIASKEAGWNAMRVAIEAGVTEKTAYSWLNGSKKPNADRFQKLRRVLPRFGELLDRQTAA